MTTTDTPVYDVYRNPHAQVPTDADLVLQACTPSRWTFVAWKLLYERVGPEGATVLVAAAPHGADVLDLIVEACDAHPTLEELCRQGPSGRYPRPLSIDKHQDPATRELVRHLDWQHGLDYFGNMFSPAEQARVHAGEHRAHGTPDHPGWLDTGVGAPLHKLADLRP